MKKATAIIQARLGSTRLPDKTLIKIGDKTLIERVIDRITRSKSIKQMVLATTQLKEDDRLINFIQQKYPKLKIYRGDSTDVVGRFQKTADLFSADPIVRITGDDPFKDPEIIDHLLAIFSQGSYDYVSNTIKHTFPEGLDIEIFSLAALKKANREGRTPKDREHVTYYIWNHPEFFRLKNIVSDKDYSSIRLTVDYAQDLKLAQKIYNYFYPRTDFSYQEIIKLLKIKPELSKLNQHIKKYESLKK